MQRNKEDDQFRTSWLYEEISSTMMGFLYGV